LALKFKFNKEISQNKEETSLNNINSRMAPNRINIGKIIKFIYIGKKSFIKQENRFKKTVFRQ